MAAEKQIDVLWDTDIGRDPDDFLAGCFLLSRPEIRLRAITISPGDRDQIALARLLLKETGHAEVKIGTDPSREKDKKSVSGCHLRLMEYYKAPSLEDADGAGWEILADALRACPEAVLFTSGPLNNVGDLLRKTDLPVHLSVSMAGYWAGPDEPPSKPEFNFNGCGWAARGFVESTRFGKRLSTVRPQATLNDVMGICRGRMTYHANLLVAFKSLCSKLFSCHHNHVILL